jgi:hypothetical protein
MASVAEAGIADSQEVPPELDLTMVRFAILEYGHDIRVRYQKASKKEMGRILNEFAPAVERHR